MDELIDSVKKTISNLQEKRSFLEDQRVHYRHIKDSLLCYDKSSFDEDATEDGHQRGQVFGEIIISSKIYLNLGYEYFVEKSQQDAIEFISEKISLISNAIGQFDAKLSEANETFANLRKVQEMDVKEADFSNDGYGDSEEKLPFMEIREELDEDGNMISSSINPTAQSFNTLMTKSKEDPSKQSDVKQEVNTDLESKTSDCRGSIGEALFDTEFEKRIRQKLSRADSATDATFSPKRGDIEEISRGVLSKTEGPVIKEVDIEDVHVKGAPGVDVNQYDPSKPAIDPKDIYSFEDIVQQLEYEDELEDGKIDEKDISYDYEAYGENYESLGGIFDDDTDEDDYEYDFGPSIVPGGAQNMFMEQVNRLREEKLKQLNESRNQYTKSILKKDNKIKDSTKKKKVGFAAELDICEIENYKEETKRNTFNGLQSSIESQIYSSNSDEEFDYELFAKMIGVKDPDALHERYEKNSAEQVSEPTLPERRSKRVSRFKKDRAVAAGGKATDEYSTVTGSTIKEEHNLQNELSESTISDITERTILVEDGGILTDVSESTSKVDLSFSKLTIEEKNDICERTGKNDNTHESQDVNPTIDLSSPETHKNIDSGGLPTHEGKRLSKFKKNLNSLQRPRMKNTNTKKRIKDLSILEEDEENFDTDKIEAESTVKAKNVEHVSEHKEDGFPTEISKIINEKECDVVQNPKVDYQVLGENIDDMARAYMLGMYNDDLDDPGTVLERLDDFESYNKQAQSLEGDVKEFLTKTAPYLESDNDEHQSSEDEGPVVVDIIEKDDINSPEECGDDIGLELATLQDEVSMSYHRLRHKIIAAQGTGQKSSQELELEPIDEHGNPIKLSRFKSSKLSMAPGQ
ncbi:LAFE_0B06128g1_1 [Lachancea fermentati]|uniref:LAFE_0B06128g1_1 n=1 Tax=Lachancea fermentati TaxID=4955 RepID=A0A1G4M7X5_LACFM|nr:LAFE_0B06128g1_1 [Lachancea fermentati]